MSVSGDNIGTPSGNRRTTSFTARCTRIRLSMLTSSFGA